MNMNCSLNAEIREIMEQREKQNEFANENDLIENIK